MLFRSKEKLKKQIKSGQLDLIIGTHALLTDDTIFHNLAFCIIDEQHRFGVAQRQKILEKVVMNQKQFNSSEQTSNTPLAPHFLAMTATPIPRSLQLTVFGDLDVSTIRQMPKGRQKIQTKVISELAIKELLYPELKRHLDMGEQVYWICRLIDHEGDVSQTEKQRTVFDEEKKLKKI